MIVKTKIVVTLALILFNFPVRGELRLPDILSDHMVLQQNSDVMLWGWSDPGQKITVTVSWMKMKYTTRADSAGMWELKVATPAASYDSQRIVIRDGGGDRRVLDDILIGEVWFCSGQSNMAMTLAGYVNQPVEGGAETALKSIGHEDVRVAFVPKTTAFTPQDSVQGKWFRGSPANASKMSAVAYHFALMINEVLSVPVGVIVSTWGGTHIECWMPRAALESVQYRAIDADAANERLGNRRPMVMYNAMIHPLRRYTIKGFLWYQGCSNVDTWQNYATCQATMVDHWRKAWGDSKLPFYWVEIAPYKYKEAIRGAYLREQQQAALDLIPNGGMISTVDLVYPYEERTIHPTRKREVGQRLALLALEDTYKLAGVKGHNPRFLKMEPLKEGGVALSFTETEEGFAVSGPIVGFEVAGEDRVFYPASARLLARQRKIAVSSPRVKEVKAVRYCFGDFAIGTLRNLWGLPVMPFRTDDWE